MNGKCTATRGRPAKPITNKGLIIKAVIRFLQMFVGEPLAKRIVSLVLITADIPNARITEATELSDRSLWMLKKSIHSGDTDALFVVGHGGGRTGKAKGFEAAIAEELEKKN